MYALKRERECICMCMTESEYVYVIERETQSLLVSLPIGVNRARMCV